MQARHDVQVSYYGVLAGVGRLTARTLALPVEYLDEERYYNEVGSKWIGWGTGNSGKPPRAGTDDVDERRLREQVIAAPGARTTKGPQAPKWPHANGK